MSNELRERLRSETVDLLLTVRNQYLAAGASPLKHWDQIQTRLRSAARTSTNVPEWITALARSLGLPAPTKRRSLATDKLERTVGTHGCATQWLDLLEDEHGYLIAKCQLLADQRKNEKEAEWDYWLTRAEEE